MKMQKSERLIGKGRQAVRMAAVLGAALVLIWCDPMVSRAEPTGTVKPSSVNIRKEPSQDSEVIGSTSGGKEISIRGKVDVSGTTWYQVYVQGDTLGYVRADMVEKKGDEEILTVSAPSADDGGQETSSEGAGEQDTAQTGGAEASVSGAQVQAQEEMEKQYASVKVASAKVRPDPSTSNNPVESIPSGTQVVVSGKSEGSDSKTWYYVTFTGANGSEKTGYIRSDLLELGEMLPVEEPPVEETPAEEPEEPEEPAPSNDYAVGIETDSEGEQVWYIYDNVTGQKQRLVPLLEASYANALGNNEDTGAIVKQRIAIVALAVLLAVAVIVIVVMAFKLRDAYYEDYEDEEEDEDEDEEEESSARRGIKREREKDAEERLPRRQSTDEEERRPRKRVEDGEERRPRRNDEEERRPRKREEAEPAARGKTDRPERRRREDSYGEEPDAREAVKSAKGRKAKNFLLDDDEFEFEFLNMDDKDLK